MASTKDLGKTRKIKTFGWLPDLPDARDFRFSALRAGAPASLPAVVSLRPGCSPVEDQGELGSCTANALVGIMEFLEKKAGDQTPTNLSRLFVYYNERVIENTVGDDSGAYLRDGVKSLARVGVCPESRWPYKTTRFAAKPTPTAFNQAPAHRAARYERLNTLDDMRRCLADGYPFAFGFTVYESFEEIGSDGVMRMPDFAGEQVLGGHAVMAIGYDDNRQLLECRNSWSEDWGDAGHFWMPYAYAENRDLSDDFWVIRYQGKVQQ